MSEEAGNVIIQLRPVGLDLTFVLSRDNLQAIMERLADAVTSVDEEAGRKLVHSRRLVDVERVIDGWALSVESGTAILHVVPRNLGGHYLLSLEQASELWRSLGGAYWLADDQIQEMLLKAFYGEDDSSGGSL